jgi:hypothetical protein
MSRVMRCVVASSLLLATCACPVVRGQTDTAPGSYGRGVFTKMEGYRVKFSTLQLQGQIARYTTQNGNLQTLPLEQVYSIEVQKKGTVRKAVLLGALVGCAGAYATWKGSGSEYTTAQEETIGIVGGTVLSVVVAFVLGSLTHEYQTVWKQPSQVHWKGDSEGAPDSHS